MPLFGPFSGDISCNLLLFYCAWYHKSAACDIAATDYEEWNITSLPYSFSLSNHASHESIHSSLWKLLISSLNQKGDTLNVSYENVGWPLMHFCLKLEDVASLTKSVTLLFTFVPHLSSTLKWHHRPTSKANSPDTHLVNPFSTKLQL